MTIECVLTTEEGIAERFDLIEVWTVEAGLESMADMLQGAAAFDVIDNGNTVGCYALGIQSLPGGRVAWLLAGQGKANGYSLTEDLLPAIESQAAESDYMAIQTARPGLVRRLLAQGYEVAGTIMVKKLK